MALDLDFAYNQCKKIAFSHYENFPVASIFIPAQQRGAIAAIYAFARQADDYADEPEYDGQRVALLNAWEEHLHDPADNPVFVALADVRQRFNLPVHLFTDLLSAFRQDLVTRRYATRLAMLDYCKLSANPVGRLVLRVAGQANAENDALSDCICTALQLANFWQDMGSDNQIRDRIYMPGETLKRHGATTLHFNAKEVSPALRACVRDEVEFAQSLFNQGLVLPKKLKGRLSLEVSLTIQGGQRILERIRQQGYDTLTSRPVLGRKDWFAIAWAMFKPHPRRAV